MIARIWTGATRTVDADDYQQYMRDVAPATKAWRATAAC